jgi:predicted Ser/Thr protein kinase
MENELAGVLSKTTPIYRRKLYPKPINKADTKPVTVNIAAISAVGTHFYIQHKENEAFSTSIYEINRILQERADKDQDNKDKSLDKTE